MNFSSFLPSLRALLSARILLLLFPLLLASCSKVPLYSDLDEEEANEIMAHLMQKEIVCTKLPGKEGKWILQVSPDAFPMAMHTLQTVGLPREKFQKMGDVFQKSGLVSSPTEERIRFISALSQEISGTLMKIDGVLAARVHIALPDNDPLSEETVPASAAVFIKYRSGYNVESAMPDLKNLVTKSIEGLNYDNVELVMTQADTLPPPVMPVVDNDWQKKIPVWGMPAGAALGGVLLTAASFMIFRRKS